MQAVYPVRAGLLILRIEGLAKERLDNRIISAVHIPCHVRVSQ